VSFEGDYERHDENPEPERDPTRAQDVEACARNNDPTEYCSSRQVDGQPVERVQEEARGEKQRE